MAATVAVCVDKGSTPTEVDVTSNGVRFRTDDNPNQIDDTYPVPLPVAGTKYSYWVHLFLKVTGGVFTQVNNIKFFTAGGSLYGDAGVDLMVGTETPEKNSGSTAGYDEAVGTEGDSGTEMTSGHSGITATTNANLAITSAPKDVSISEAGGAIDAAGETSDYVVLQINVGTSAVRGLKSAATLTFRYDET